MTDRPKMKKLEWKGFLSVNNAEIIKEELSRSLSETDNLVIDVSAVEDIDVSIIQLMYAVKKEASQTGKKCSFTGTFAEDVRHYLRVCGLIENEQLNDEQIADACTALGEELS